MHILTDAQRIFLILLMWADFVLAVGLHIWYRLKVEKKYYAVLLKSGIPSDGWADLPVYEGGAEPGLVRQYAQEGKPLRS